MLIFLARASLLTKITSAKTDLQFSSFRGKMSWHGATYYVQKYQVTLKSLANQKGLGLLRNFILFLS